MLDDATTRVRSAAFAEGDESAALAAVSLYLDRLNTQGQKDPSCFDKLESDVPALRRQHCVNGSPKQEDESCILLDKIQFDIERLRAQRVVEEADKKPLGQAQDLFVRSGELYLASFREHCEGPFTLGRPGHVPPSACDEVAYNAARAFGGARLNAKVIGAYRMLINYEQKTKRSSPLAAKAMYEIGGAYRSMALFDQAAEWFERYATLNPRALEAVRALSDATILRLGLGQADQATKNAALLTKNWGFTRRPDVAQLLLAIALHHGERQEHLKARAFLSGAMEMLDRGPVDLQVRAHALLARSAPELAKQEYAKVRAAWNDPAAAHEAIRRGWPSEDESRQDVRLARALNAVGEAIFAEAEERRKAEVEPLKFPVYAGAADRAPVLAHIQGAVKDWYVKKRAAIERIESDYIKVIQLEPVPPPTWVIASGAAVGLMWGDLADDFRRVPMPGSWRNDRALSKAFTEAIEAMSEGIRNGRAKPAMRKCIELAVKYQYVDARARKCDAWLAANYKSEHHVVDELIPGLVPGSRPADSPPLTYEGQLLQQR